MRPLERDDKSNRDYLAALAPDWSLRLFLSFDVQLAWWNRSKISHNAKRLIIASAVHSSTLPKRLDIHREWSRQPSRVLLNRRR
jgi:hypothetical protein